MEEMLRSLPLPVFFLTMLGFAVGQNDCGNCLHLDSGAMVGIITVDVIITVGIAGFAFFVSHKIVQQKYEAKQKQKKAPENDHTYEHLRGQQTDVYTDINTLKSS